MSPQNWREVITEIERNTASFEGRKYLYIKPGEIEWFDDEREALKQGFHPAKLAEIHQIAANTLETNELQQLDTTFSTLIDISKVKNLLSNPDTPSNTLYTHGMLMFAKAKKSGNRIYKEHGRTCLQAAALKFINEGNIPKANICKKLLIQNVEVEEGHPLSNVRALTDVERTNQSVAKGIFVSNLNGGNLKNGVVKVSRRNMGREAITKLSFKVSYPARKELNQHLQAIQDNLDDFKSTVCSQICEEVIISKTQEGFAPFHDNNFHPEEALEIDDGETIEIDFVNVGKVRIGANPSIGCSYNQIELEFSKEPDVNDVQKILNAIGLGIDLGTSLPEDMERRKVMGMFHNHFPRQAYEFENRAETYNLDIEALKKAVCVLEPRMEEVFSYYEEHPEMISEQEIFPGMNGMAFLDIPEKVREAGGVGLILGVPYGNVAPRVAAMLKTGPLATQSRYDAGLLVNGASSSFDYASGGGDSVFTRMVTETSIEDEVSITMYPLSGQAQILIDLDVLARGGYAFTEDVYGQKNRFDMHEEYANRDTLWECTAQVNDSLRNLYRNEYMIKQRIPPSYIRGVVVSEESTKQKIIEALESEGMTTVNGKSLEEFIHVAKFFNENMWGK